MIPQALLEDVLAETPEAMQLRYLSTLNVIANENNTSTIIFPFPMELGEWLARKKD